MLRLATGSALSAACRASPQQQQQQARRAAPMQPSTSSPWSSLPPQAAAARSSNPSSRWQGTLIFEFPTRCESKDHTSSYLVCIV